ncbi:class III extradiol ring-cleavage dioxygenase [Aquabacterium sp.]|uniref:DODA-type extradiol aromatic ring-opening family dioxygenase n=1 Tax=Aquabacterium sp. TaxID=1872578 RepID=UPI002E370BD5|nr:class III extradiol ring-cleavage dioxygenase [Aquabacterium sp.]HEX5312680.1 class III extradiol ring-cleavage dioxygenase [Aquabacterium sp.]
MPDHLRPTLFLSHGSPMMALEPGAAGLFLHRLGPRMNEIWGKPKAFVVVSPHTATMAPVVLGASRHETVHDFGGFPEALYHVRYDTAGEPDVARRVAELMAGLPGGCRWLDRGGLDHGIWTLLMHLHPAGDVPVVPLSLTPRATPQQLMQQGQALQALRAENVQIIGSGSLTHNLRRFFESPEPVDADEDDDCLAFREWVREKTEAGDWDALFHYRSRAPYATEMHPTDEHWLPFYLAAGAACNPGEATPNVARRIHSGVTHGHLAMDGYVFASSSEALEGLV